MKLAYFLVLIFATILFYYIGGIYKSHGEPSRRGLRILLFLSAGYALSFMIGTFSPWYPFSVFGFTVYHCFTIWINFIYLLFSLQYARFKEVPKRLKDILFVVCVIDNIAVIASVRTNIIFSVKKMSLFGEYIYRWSQGDYYMWHYNVAAIFIIAFVGTLIYKFFRDPILYKAQYVIVFITIIFCEVTNNFFIRIDAGIDFTSIKYGLMAVILVYLTRDFISSYLKNGIISRSFEKSKIAMLLFDQHDRCVDFNSYAKTLFDDIQMSYTNDSFCKKYLNGNPDSYVDKKLFFNVDEEERIYRLEYSKILDDAKRYLGSYFFFHDITQSEQENAKKLMDVSRDALTGIYNEAGFYIGAKDRIRNSSEKYNLVAINISDFKLVNDVLGRRTGDEVLKVLADTLRENTPSKTICARIVADHFALLVKSDFRINDLEKIVNDKLKQDFSSLSIICYFAVHGISDTNESIEFIYEEAGIALGAIKNGGSEHIVYYKDEMKEKTLSDNKLLADMDKGIKNEEFQLYFQPQIDSYTENVIGAEALIRWNHPERGFLTPFHFIGLFEEYGLLYELDKYVWESACKTIKKLHNLGFPLAISVNISANDIFVGDLYKYFVDLVEKYDIDAKYLRLEITETAVMLDINKLKNLVIDLQKVGFTIEMDDFGSGYSSLNTLKDIPVDIIKTDMLFMSKTENEERNYGIFRSIVNLADALKTPLLAEGVETAEQVKLLKGLGCHNIQGYYYAKPMPYDELVEFIKAHDLGEFKA